jgi:hypothetical protein
LTFPLLSKRPHQRRGQPSNARLMAKFRNSGKKWGEKA